jgi:hypothetical protein
MRPSSRSRNWPPMPTDWTGEAVAAAVRPIARQLWRDAPMSAKARSTYGATDGL